MNQCKIEYPTLLKRKIGKYLKKAPHGSQKIIAQALGLSDRTLRSWKNNVSDKRKGRKIKKLCLSEIKIIIGEWRRQGRPGVRPVSKALPHIPVRRIREIIFLLKKKDRFRKKIKFQKSRISIDVGQAGIILTMDGATIRKGEDLVIAKDRGSLQIAVQKCRKSLRSKDVLRVLARFKSRGRLPLVLCTDNGSPFCSNEVHHFLKENKVIHLRSLPRVPQHNGACENAVKEVKNLLKDGHAVVSALKVLNQCLKRRRLGYKTAALFDKENRACYDENIRQEIYERAQAEIERSYVGTKNGYEKRKREREAILSTLECLALIKITRGHQNMSNKAEVNA